MCLGLDSSTVSEALLPGQKLDLARQEVTFAEGKVPSTSDAGQESLDGTDPAASKDMEAKDESVPQANLSAWAEEFQRVHGQCTRKWRQLSAQRRQQNGGVKTDRSKSNKRKGLRELPPLPGLQSENGHHKSALIKCSPRRSKMDDLRRRHVQCMSALKTAAATEKQNRPEPQAEKMLDDLVKRTTAIQAMQEDLQQNLKLRSQYEALKSLNEALLVELESLKSENRTLTERVKELEEVKSEEVSFDIASSDSECMSSTKSDAGEAPMTSTVSGLNLMSPYAGWARLITPPQ
mmetsp:Transcript_58754/g.140013  ORF Transcript_58754/g.140013 Transcript_58754/m.140013 type:complete len:292 (-) Transcript_58754:190-1065(-)